MISKSLFGTLSDGREVFIYSITNKTGSRLGIINYGAIVQSLYVKDSAGNFADVVLGYDNIEGYVNDTFYIGAIVGRYGNRIAKGKFKLNGSEYQLSINNPPNHLHGGVSGFSKALWEADSEINGSSNSIRLTYISKDGEEGYPGTAKLSVIYTLTEDNSLEIKYEGTSDKATPFNPTHHSYFNLSGNFDKDILGHELQINADKFTPTDETAIPAGELRSVNGTPFDFHKPSAVGSRINDSDEQLKLGSGYDHNMCINGFNGEVRKAAEVYESGSGRMMEVFTDQPGMQFYSANFLDGKIVGKNGSPLLRRSGLCLESQAYPDSPNRPEFPSAILKPDEVYHQTTIYKFAVK